MGPGFMPSQSATEHGQWRLRKGRESEAYRGKSQTTETTHSEVVKGGGVRFWGTAARIEPVCSMGKQNGCNPNNVLAFALERKSYLDISVKEL